jgi:hypothetical protein
MDELAQRRAKRLAQVFIPPGLAIEQIADPSEWGEREESKSRHPAGRKRQHVAFCEEEHASHCPACGEVIDYCQGHGDLGDPTGHRILLAHTDDDHAQCHPLADCASH